MEWNGQKEFVASPEVYFEVDGSKAGLLKTYGALSSLFSKKLNTLKFGVGNICPVGVGDSSPPPLEAEKRLFLSTAMLTGYVVWLVVCDITAEICNHSS